MSMYTTNKYSKEVKQFKDSNTSSGEKNTMERVSPIYEAGKAYYDYLRNSKSMKDDNECDHCTAFMMF